MVDYILKIDIDESDLVRKLKSALKKADMFSGGGIAGGVGGGGAAAKQVGKERGMLSEAAYKRVEEYKEKQTAFREGQANTLLLDNELKIGRKADSHAKTMERMGALQNNWTKKMFNIGTVVKLAGLATGVAGLMQMRKMVIDSSPVLQAMLKLLNVGIMFILRPIGDFFGFVLRPLLIPFISMASQYYAERLGIIQETGGDLGQAALTGDTATMLDRWLRLPQTLWGDPEKAAEALKIRKELEATGDTTFFDLYNVMKLLNPQVQIFKLQLTTLAALFGMGNPPAQACPNAFGLGDKAPCGADYYGPGGGGHPDVDFSGNTPTQTTGTDYYKKLTEKIALSDSGIQTDVEPANCPFENQKTQENWMEIERQLEELNQESLKREFDRLIEIEHQGIQINQYILDMLESNATKEEFWSGGFTKDASNELIEDYQKQLESAEARRTELESMGKSTKEVDGTIGDLNAKIQEQIDNISAVNNKLKDLSNSVEVFQQKLNSTNFTGTGSSGSFSGSSGGSNTVNGVTYQVSPYTGLTAVEAGNVELAGGGVISEEIYGIGKCTGKKYRFGEQGDEAIIPINCFNSLVGGMGRIGMSSVIGSRNTTGSSVGKFTGISASRYSRFTSDVFNAANRTADAQCAVDEMGEFTGAKKERTGTTRYKCSHTGRTWQWAIMSTTAEYQKYLDEMKPLQNELATATAQLSGANDKLNPYTGAYSDTQTISALQGQREFEGGGDNTTNLGGITINVSGAQNTDTIVEQIGPKLLKYLQDNDRRVGIR